MIFCPLPGVPIITQGFGQNPHMYAAYGHAGHNGLDFDCPEGTTVYAPHDGVASVRDDGAQGYGLFLTIDDVHRRSVLAHLSEVLVESGQSVYQGDPVAKTGTTGFSVRPHLHWTFKLLKDGVVQHRDNGYGGAMDVTECTRLWLDQDLHHDARYSAEAEAYLSMTFAPNQYLRNPARAA